MAVATSIVMFVFSYLVFGDPVSGQQCVAYGLASLTLIVYGIWKSNDVQVKPKSPRRVLNLHWDSGVESIPGKYHHPAKDSQASDGDHEDSDFSHR